MSSERPVAIVTGASSGIGYGLAKCCAEGGFDLVVCADEPEIRDAAYGRCERCGRAIEPGRLEALPEARYCSGCARR